MQIDFIDCRSHFIRNPQQMGAPVCFVFAPHHESQLLKIGDQPFEITGVQPEIARQVGSGGCAVMRQFVKDADFRQGKVAFMQPLVQCARMTRVEAVEMPYGFRGPARI